MLRIHEDSAITESEWDSFILSDPNGTIFQTSKWLDILEKNQSLKKKLLAIYDGNSLIGLLPLFTKRVFLLNIAGSPFVVEDTPYMGPVVGPSFIGELMPLLEAYMKRHRIHYLRVTLPYHCQTNNDIEPCRLFEKHTHALDLGQSEDQLWKSLKGRCRTAIRKAKKSGVGVERASKRGFIDVYYRIIGQVYGSQHKPCPNPKQLYRDIWDTFEGENALFLSATYEGTPIAGVIVILDRSRAYYLNGAALHDFRSLSASNLLLWEAIKMAKGRGVQTFDFVGSDIPRLAKFKASFGGSLTKYTLLEIAGSKWISWIRGKYPAYKQVLGHLALKSSFGRR